MVLLRLDSAEGKKVDSARMNFVPFNHKAHEAANDTCLICHHENLQSCSRCHTTAGVKEGNFVRLESAMHQRGSKQSCIGCHESIQQKPQCAACHEGISQTRTPAAATCSVCHIAPETARITVAGLDDRQAAEMLYASGKAQQFAYRDDEIPEKVTIGILSDLYEPVALPHRKIVRTLLSNIRGDKLADYFHREKGTVCQGCHHNSPASMKPPRCAGCHGQPFDRSNASRPGLKGAYHQQCMGCHQKLKLAKPAATACTECHQEKQGRKTTG